MEEGRGDVEEGSRGLFCLLCPHCVLLATNTCRLNCLFVSGGILTFLASNLAEQVTKHLAAAHASFLCRM